MPGPSPTIHGVLPPEAFADDLDEFVEVEWLEDRVADRFVRNLVDAALAGGGEHNDMRAAFWKVLPDLLDEFVAVEPRHHEVEKDEVELAVVLDLLEAGSSIFGQVDVELHALEDGLKEDANGQVVVDDEDPASSSVDLAYRHPLPLVNSRIAKDIPGWSIRLGPSDYEN
jgi:hypothetical protein